ncbi:helix-turn-helix transcriptional regulator [Mycobacterium helveticum]|jgi:predicted ArsR family transcriptional regulator|uniref:Helix-turn-helix domain-containing protein n=1 Tax=Mycobacterium helveticum TaxID=2592811 RepID=A0A557XZN9_9MYCO|nr:helix-turn-helix domain-containing protein [Mycobacterium helveticum]TVS89632.1 helix-turn-helix domain-containing protein [Mycobacterium helveticum]TVS91705.1 helix-turn-helix domain-containing protein [Mycobacterium helveticum]
MMVEVTPVRESVGRRRRVLQVLRASPDPMSIAAIAEVLGVHPNTVRFHLDILLGDGQVERVEPGRKGPGRPALMFRAVRQMDRGGARHYRMLAEILAEALASERDPRAKALGAGRAWARRTQSAAQPPGAEAIGAAAAVDRLVGLLDDLGFAPERRTAAGREQIGLRHCPFLEIAENGTGVVCPAHLGVMQGALAAWGAPVSVRRLDAFVQPDLCVAHLAPRAGAR